MTTGIYARDTEVSPAKSRAEIEDQLSRYGATGFLSGWQGNQAMIAFEAKGRRVKFLLPLPDRADRAFQFTPHRHVRRSQSEALKAWEQATRQKWRALALAVKAKLEAVASGITTFEAEFLPYLVTADGMTMMEKLAPRLDEVLNTSQLPPLLPGPGESVSA